MKYKLLKTKAIFEILLMISLTLVFSFSLSSKDIKAEETEDLGCCAETIDGNNCQYVEQSKCKEGEQFNPTTCDTAEFCKPGCCDLTSSGTNFLTKTCYAQTDKKTCEQQQGNFLDDGSCSYQQCNRGCCVVGSQAAYTTLAGCQLLNDNYLDLDIDFRTEITNEAECTAIVLANKEGCCVNTNEDTTKTCRSGIEAECSGEFYSEALCSSLPQETCGCTKHNSLSCIENSPDVYWIDSCGNREEIASLNDVEDFTRLGIEAFNGKCDYSQGTTCGAIIENGKEHSGCMNLNCESTYDNLDDATDGNGKPRTNGERWCQYDMQFGPGMGLPGARSFKHYCENGKEIAEQCGKFAREDICVSKTTPINGKDFGTAECVPLKTEDCASVCKTKSCCEDQTRTCLWIDTNKSKNDLKVLVEETNKKLEGETTTASSNEDQENGMCIPLIPQGQEFWDLQGEDSGNGVCDIADRNEATIPAAPIVYWEYSAPGLGWRYVDYHLDWNCGGNCEAYKKDYINGANSLCGIYGDCGAKYNIAGEWSSPIESFKRNCYPEDTESEGGGSDLSKSRISKDEGVFENKDNYYEDYTTCTNEVSLPNPSTFNEYKKIETNIFDLGEQTFDDTSGNSHSPFLNALGIGTGVASIGYTLSQSIAKGLMNFNYIGLGITVIAIVGGIVLHYMSDSYEAQITVDCNAWQAPKGGDYCHLCHEPGKDAQENQVDFTANGTHDCTEYLCKSLGSGCEFTDTYEGSKCLNICDMPESTKLALIAPSEDLKEKLKGMCRTTDEDESDIKDCELGIEQAQAYGVLEIKDPIKANTNINITLQTCEDTNCEKQMYADCRYDTKDIQSFEEAGQTFLEVGNSYTHTLQLKANTDIFPGTEYTYYVQCKTRCGYPEGLSPTYQIKFKTATAPDIMHPELIDENPIDPINQGLISFDAWNHSDKIPVEASFTLKERTPECRYEKNNVGYESMKNKVQCLAPTTGNSQVCKVPLYNLTFGENTFYVKCKDRNDIYNVDALPDNNGYILTGTNPLSIDSVKCITEDGDTCGTIYYDKFMLEVVVSGGADGTANCKYQWGSSPFTSFNDIDSTILKQQFGPGLQGEKKVSIECQDKAGNINQTSINYNIMKDTAKPIITKIYQDGSNLILNTDKDAVCKYTNTKLGNEEEKEFDGTGKKEHVTIIAENDYFNVKCADKFSNEVVVGIFVSRD